MPSPICSDACSASTRGVDTAGRSLGIGLAQLHVTIAMRQAVGLPGGPGLLVQTVDPDGSTGRRVVRECWRDVLTAVDGRPLRSLAGLRAHLDASPGPTTSIDLIRGTAPSVVMISR